MTVPLTPKQERILVLFKLAIEKERDSQKLYSEMLLNCEDPELKPIIESLRVAEQTHEEILLDRYAALRKTDQYGN
jgi:rubrerythrin